MAGCRDQLAFLWGGGVPHQNLVPITGESRAETISGHQTRTGSMYHGCCGRAGSCNSKPYWFLLLILCLCLFWFVCVRVRHDGFLSLPRAVRGLVVLGDDLFDERVTKGGHHIGHHFWFGVLSQEGHMRYSGFLGKK